jgi:hypothetical protein
MNQRKTPSLVLSNEDYFSISRELDAHHSLFYAMWEMGKPVFDESVGTAGVRFDKTGEFLEFAFAPSFWQELTPYGRLFVLAHEFLHVILNHGVRATGGKEKERANRTLDVVVNELLVSKFGFDRSQVPDDDKYCWVDTVFPSQNLPKGESYEFYYNRHPKTQTITITLDNHNGMLGGGAAGKIIDNLDGLLSPEEKASLRDTLEKHFEGEDEGGNLAGTESGGHWTFVSPGPVVKKRKWETVIKKWSRKYDRPDFKDVEQWARINRRFVGLSADLMLPTEMEVDHEIEGKIDVWFFLDTSGSCAHLATRFFKAALSLDPKRFNIQLFCFDTKVYPTTLESKKVYGFGGTAFAPIETYIKSHCDGKYPLAVFLITDGYGNAVHPAFPERWYVFLTTGNKYYFPPQSNIFNLKDYE